MNQPVPVPPDADLRDFHFYPLEVRRLLDSALSATDPEVFRVAVLSWCVAWHQLPAGSLPDNDDALSRLMGFGRAVKSWKKIRAAGGMRGWEPAVDGRLYHPVVTAKVLEALAGKRKQRGQTEAARTALHRKRHGLSQTSVTDSKLTVESREKREDRGHSAQVVIDHPDETGGAEPPTEPVTVSDRELIRPLAPWVRWRTGDPETTADNIAELAGLVRLHGAQVIMIAARIGHAGGEKLWPNEVPAHLPRAALPATPAPEPYNARAVKLLAKHGLEGIRRLTQVTLANESEAVQAMTCNPALADMVERGAA